MKKNKQPKPTLAAKLLKALKIIAGLITGLFLLLVVFVLAESLSGNDLGNNPAPLKRVDEAKDLVAAYSDLKKNSAGNWELCSVEHTSGLPLTEFIETMVATAQEQHDAMLALVKPLPAIRHSDNIDGYEALACYKRLLNQDDSKYVAKVEHYKAKRAEAIEAEERLHKVESLAAAYCRMGMENMALYGMDFSWSDDTSFYKYGNGYRYVRNTHIINAFGSARKTRAVCDTDSQGTPVNIQFD